MAQIGKIRCDLCGFIGDLETYNGKANMRTPAGWASVSTTIRVAGELKLEREERKRLKLKVAAQFPRLHVCPACMGGRIFDVRFQIPLKAS